MYNKVKAYQGGFVRIESERTPQGDGDLDTGRLADSDSEEPEGIPGQNQTEQESSEVTSSSDIEPRPPEITSDQRLRAQKLAENIIRAMEEEERDRLIERGLDKAGFLRSLLFRGKVIRDVDAAQKFRVTPEMRDIIEEYALQQVVSFHITASGNELYRLMQERGFAINPETGRFIPTHADSNWLNRLLHIDRAKTTGAIFAGGIVLGHTARAAMATVLDGVGKAVGAGALVGGISGWLRGRREATEATGSGDAWVADMQRALNSGNEGEIELACHKAERLMMDPAARQEFFRGRTRHETVRILEKYQEGMRRLAISRMAREAAETISAERNPEATPREVASLAAELYVRFCEDMAGVEETTAFVYESNKHDAKPIKKTNRRLIADEQAFERMYGRHYLEAFARELSIIRGENAVPINPDDAAAREQVLIGYDRDARLRRNNRRRIVASHIIRGAIIGGIAGGVGYYIGNLLLGSGGHEGVDTATAPDSESSNSGVWGRFENENTMPEQGFTLGRVQDLGLNDLANDPRCPSSFIDGQLFYGTDQGAALREAVLMWKDQLNFHGMDPDRVANIMNFAGSDSAALPFDVGAEYSFSLEQVQSVIDHIANVGEKGIFDANSIMALNGLNQLEGAVATSAEQGTRGLWPGWLLLAGAAGYKIDSDLRSTSINETTRQAAISPIGPPVGEPHMGRDIKTFTNNPPKPETDNQPSDEKSAGSGSNQSVLTDGSDREDLPNSIQPSPRLTEESEKQEGSLSLEDINAREQELLRRFDKEELDKDSRIYRKQLKVGNQETLLSTREIETLFDKLKITGENVTSKIKEQELIRVIKQKIESNCLEKNFSFQSIANILMKHPTKRAAESDSRLRLVFKRDEIRELLAGANKQNSLIFPQQIREKFASWIENQAKRVAHALILLRAQEEMKNLAQKKSKIEAGKTDSEPKE